MLSTYWKVIPCSLCVFLTLTCPLPAETQLLALTLPLGLHQWGQNHHLAKTHPLKSCSVTVSPSSSKNSLKAGLSSLFPNSSSSRVWKRNRIRDKSSGEKKKKDLLVPPREGMWLSGYLVPFFLSPFRRVAIQWLCHAQEKGLMGLTQQSWILGGD